MSNYLDHTNEMYRTVKAMLASTEKNLEELEMPLWAFIRGQKAVLEALLIAMEGDKDYLMNMYELTKEDIWPPLGDTK